MNQAETIHASWVKREKMNMTLLDAAHADSRDNVQLEVEYKAFLNGTSKGGSGPSIQNRQQQVTRDQLNRAKKLGEELVRDDLTDEDLAFQYTDAFLEHDPHGRHNASVNATRKSDGERPGRYRPVRSKVFLERLKRAKEEKDSIKVKDMDKTLTSAFSKAYIIVNLNRTTSEYRVIIGRRPSCNCDDFVKNESKEFCKHILWVYLFICKLPENSTILQQLFLTTEEVSLMLANSPSAIPEEHKLKETHSFSTRREKVRDILSENKRY